MAGYCSLSRLISDGSPTIPDPKNIKCELKHGILVQLNSNLFANHITFDNGYTKCAHKRQRNTNYYFSNLIRWVQSRRVGAPGTTGSHETKSSVIWLFLAHPSVFSIFFHFCTSSSSCSLGGRKKHYATSSHIYDVICDINNADNR